VHTSTAYCKLCDVTCGWHFPHCSTCCSFSTHEAFLVSSVAYAGC